MKHSKIITFKVEYNDKEKIETFVKQLTGFANGNAIMMNVDVTYVTVEQGFDVK